MSMFGEEVQAFFGNAYVAAVALAGLITVFLRLLTRVLDLHDRHVVHKEFERLRKLREVTTGGTPLAAYLDGSIQRETFRIASGITASPEKMKYLLELSAMGRWDRNQLRSISGFVRLEPESAEPSIYMGRSSTFDAMFCLFGGFYFVCAGVFFLVYCGLYLPSPFGWVAGAGLCLVFFVCTIGMWKGFIDFLIAKQAKAYLSISPSRNAQDEQAAEAGPVSAAAT